MKRGFLLALIIASCMALPLFAQESGSQRVWDHGDNISEYSYRNVNILQIYDAPGAYIVFYEKASYKMGQITIPKKWAVNNAGKLQFRNKPAGLSSYMTVVYKNGEFYKVLLTLPSNRNDSVWAVTPRGIQIPNADAETLEIEF